MSRPVADVDALPPAAPMTWPQRRTYWAYRSAWALVAALPRAVARRLPELLGRSWHRRAPERQRELVRGHMRRLRPDADDATLDALVRAAYTSYVRYWIEAFRLHRMDVGDVLAAFSEERLHLLDEPLEDGGAILATAHHGSWDVGGMWSVARGWPMVVVAEVVEPRPLFERFVRLRVAAGMGVIPLVRGGDMVERLTTVVEEGGLATLLADRDLTGKGPIVSFCGEPCRFPPGTAVLARRTGRPVVVGSFVTDDDGWRGVLSERVDIAHLPVDEGTQVLASAMERHLRRFPEQWHVFVPQWLADREPSHPAVESWRRDPEGWIHDPSWREEA